MTLCTNAVKNGTTDEPTANQRVLNLDSTHPIEVDGGDVVFVDAYEYTADGTALRFAGDQPVATTSVYSPRDLRTTLLDAGYERDHIDFALKNTLSGKNGQQAARIAESREYGPDAEVATDGGEQIERCEGYGATATADEYGDIDLIHDRDCSQARGVVDPYPGEEEINDVPL
jgi:hypothetical protein